LLLRSIVQQFVNDEEVGVKTQLMEIIRMLLDSEPNEDAPKVPSCLFLCSSCSFLVTSVRYLVI
jgi:hypothetical protein